KKCLGKMNEVGRSGRTVLFVSHNMAAVESLCTRGVVLENGRLAFDGNPLSAIRFYHESTREADNAGRYVAKGLSATNDQSVARILSASITSRGESCDGHFAIGDPLEFTLKIEAMKEIPAPAIGIVIRNKNGI